MRIVKALYVVALLALLSAGALHFIVVGAQDLRAPYSLDFGEGVSMWQAQHVFDLAQVYHPITQYPYAVLNYPPLYFFVTRMASLCCGDLLTAGRLVSLVSGIGVGICCGLVVWFALPKRLGVALRATGLLLAALLCYNLDALLWARLMRVDALAIVFTFAGLLLFFLSAWYAGFDYAAFLFFILAVYTKQTMICAPAVCLLLVAVVSWRRALRLLLFTVACGAVPLVVLAIRTHGTVIANLFIHRKNAFKLLNMFGMMSNNIYPVAAVAALAAAPSALRARQFASSRWRVRWLRNALLFSRPRRATVVFGLHVVAAFLFSTSAGKRGSNINYFMEWNLSACVLAAFFIARLIRRWDARWMPGNVAALAMVLLWAVRGPNNLAQRLVYGSGHGEREHEYHEVLAHISNLPGPVLSEDELLLVRANKQVPAEMDMVSLLAEVGAWDQSTFVQMLRSGKFSAVVVTSSLNNRNRFTSEMEQAIETAYKPGWTYPDYQVYIPRKPD